LGLILILQTGAGVGPRGAWGRAKGAWDCAKGAWDRPR
jgi:hypothetical protein